eukprot:TRINITY_DN20260_c0_g1_i1.p1 TRINITY_DN20260_c0_g1~~TRINITY_DN20260_c0_g1_i1.p1  ORF type:complete len:726 (+),score=136.63 TRINITY_DN20260_c0_g1_i1:99-2276(+)
MADTSSGPAAPAPGRRNGQKQKKEKGKKKLEWDESVSLRYVLGVGVRQALETGLQSTFLSHVFRSLQVLLEYNHPVCFGYLLGHLADNLGAEGKHRDRDWYKEQITSFAEAQNMHVPAEMLRHLIIDPSVPTKRRKWPPGEQAAAQPGEEEEAAADQAPAEADAEGEVDLDEFDEQGDPVSFTDSSFCSSTRGPGRRACKNGTPVASLDVLPIYSAEDIDMDLLNGLPVLSHDSLPPIVVDESRDSPDSETRGPYPARISPAAFSSAPTKRVHQRPAPAALKYPGAASSSASAAPVVAAAAASLSSAAPAFKPGSAGRAKPPPRAKDGEDDQQRLLTDVFSSEPARMRRRSLEPIVIEPEQPQRAATEGSRPVVQEAPTASDPRSPQPPSVPRTSPPDIRVGSFGSFSSEAGKSADEAMSIILPPPEGGRTEPFRSGRRQMKPALRSFTDPVDYQEKVSICVNAALTDSNLGEPYSGSSMLSPRPETATTADPCSPIPTPPTPPQRGASISGGASRGSIYPTGRASLTHARASSAPAVIGMRPPVLDRVHARRRAGTPPPEKRSSYRENFKVDSTPMQPDARPELDAELLQRLRRMVLRRYNTVPAPPPSNLMQEAQGGRVPGRIRRRSFSLPQPNNREGDDDDVVSDPGKDSHSVNGSFSACVAEYIPPRPGSAPRNSKEASAHIEVKQIPRRPWVRSLTLREPVLNFDVDLISARCPDYGSWA